MDNNFSIPVLQIISKKFFNTVNDLDTIYICKIMFWHNIKNIKYGFGS